MNIVLIVPLVLLLIVAAGTWFQLRHTSAVLDGTRGRLEAVRERAEALDQNVAGLEANVSSLESENAALGEKLDQVRASKVVTRVRTVKQEVPTWIPNGDEVTVEVTGFDGVLSVNDVQLTHAFGYSSLVGIAVNEGDRPIAYAELSCSLLDADGRVLANGIDTKLDWPAHATWGFECGEPVDATGGILRVEAAM